MKKSKTLILWGCEDLIRGAVEGVLSAHTEWTVIRVPDGESYDALSQEVAQHKPSVVILTRIESDKDATLPLKLMQDYPGVKVITICLENNHLEVFNKQNVRIKAVADLISVLES